MAKTKQINQDTKKAMPKVVSGNCDAYITGTEAWNLRKLNPDMKPADLQYWSGDENYKPSGWVKVGRAKITLTLDSMEEINKSLLAGVDEEEQQALAEHQAKMTGFERRRQELLALTAPTQQQEQQDDNVTDAVIKPFTEQELGADDDQPF